MIINKQNIHITFDFISVGWRCVPLLLFFFSSQFLTAQSITVTTTPNTACNGLPCDWQGPTILINELMISPISGDGSMVGPGPNGGLGEWIELYNPDVCNSVDISCYYLGNFTFEGAGGFRLPNNIIVPPAGFVIVRGALAPAVPPASLIQNGGNVIEIIAPTEIFMAGVCVVGTPGNRLWFPNAGGWFAFYDANGVPQDAVRWGPQNISDLTGQPCLPTLSGCPSASSLPSYNQIPTNLKFFASSAEAGTHVGQSIRRVPDGAAWAGVGNATYANCNAGCFDPGVSTCLGTATVTGAPGLAPYTYLWNDEEAQTTQTAIGLCAGTYSVTVTSSNGVISSSNVTIVNFVPPVSFNMNTSFCVNSPTAPITNFSPTPTANQLGIFAGPGVVQTQFNPSTAGIGNHLLTYTFTDQFGCTNNAQTVVSVTALPVLTISTQSPYCVNNAPSQITLNPAGGTLSGLGVSGTTFNPAVAGVGTHTLTYQFTDANGCSNTTTATVLVNPIPQIAFTTPGAFCIDDAPQSLIATPSGGTFTNNSNPVTSFNPAVYGIGNHNFTYTVTSNLGCTNSSNLLIAINPLPTVNFDILNDLCLNSSFYIFEDFSVSPQPGTSIFSGPGVTGNGILASVAGIGAHTVLLEYTDLNGCQNFDDATILVYGLPELSVINLNERYCITDSVTNFVFTPDGGTLFGSNVANNQFFPFINQAGLYDLYYIYIDQNGCTDTLDFGLEVTPIPNVEILTPAYVCENEAPFLVNTIPSSGGILTINGINENVFNPAIQGVGVHEFYFEYTDLVGCFNSTSRLIFVAAMPEIFVNLTPIEDCPPIQYTFFAEFLNGESCQWNFGDGAVSNTCLPIDYSYSEPGCYSPIFTVTSEFGCVSDTTLVNLICVFPQPVAFFEYAPNQLTIFNSNAQFINLSEGASQYQWIFDINGNSTISTEIHPEFNFPDGVNGAYPVSLIAISADGCIDTFSVSVIVISDIIIYVPNTFTPNGDFNNDLWYVFIEGIMPESFQLEVYNRWGELIWESKNPSAGWDGSYLGLAVPFGTYVWKIKANELFTGEEHTWYGHVDVIR